jgi:hypothetical protein
MEAMVDIITVEFLHNQQALAAVVEAVAVMEEEEGEVPMVEVVLLDMEMAAMDKEEEEVEVLFV